MAGIGEEVPVLLVTALGAGKRFIRLRGVEPPLFVGVFE